MSVVAAKGSSSGKNFWTKMLSAQKVKRILEKRGLDPESFRKNYESDTNRGPRRASRPSDKEVNSVEAFLKTGDYAGLMT